MSNLTPEQQKALDELASLDQKYRQGKVEAHARHRRLADEEIHDLKLARDIAAARAGALGVPKIRIAQDGLHTTHVQAARKAIASGEAVLAPAVSLSDIEAVGALGKRLGIKPSEEFAETVAQFTADPNLLLSSPGVVSVTLREADFRAFGIEEEGTAEWLFTVSEDGVVQPVDGEKDETWTHPVVQVVMGQDDSWRRRIVGFARKEGEE